MSISISNLTKTYGTQKAVNDISFSVSKGAIVGFLGPNGAGKSTTMKIITGYLNPDSGTVLVGETNVLEQPLATKKKIGYLPESNPLYYDMYVREYLGFIADVHQLSNKKEAVEKAITRVGLSPESSKKIGQLSKGYKQRVGLAAALIHDPEVLILDEPTTGLDPNQIIEIREVIKQLGENKTVLFSSHILQEVEAICDRVIIINKGNIVADSNLSNLLKDSKGEDRIVVRFKEATAPAVFSMFADVKALDEYALSIATTNADADRRTIMETAISQQLNIVSLSQEADRSLEDIFRSLTQKASS